MSTLARRWRGPRACVADLRYRFSPGPLVARGAPEPDRLLRELIFTAVASLAVPGIERSPNLPYGIDAARRTLTTKEVGAIQARLAKVEPPTFQFSPHEARKAAWAILPRRRLWQVGTRAAYLRYLAGGVPSPQELEAIRRAARATWTHLAIYVIGAAVGAFTVLDSTVNLATDFRPPDPALLGLKPDPLTAVGILLFSGALLAWCGYSLGTTGRLARGPGEFVRIAEEVAAGRKPGELLTVEGLPRN